MRQAATRLAIMMQVGVAGLVEKQENMKNKMRKNVAGCVDAVAYTSKEL